MTTPEYKYHSTGQFRNAVKNIQMKAKFKGFDDEGNAIIDKLAIAPSLNYTGTVKLHGTNASVILHDMHTITFNSKARTLATLTTNRGFVLHSDNSEFAQSMYRREAQVDTLLTQAENLCLAEYGCIKYPIKISGEWAGQGVQKGVGVSFLPKKSFFVFGVKIGDEWHNSSTLDLKGLEDSGVYNIYDFPTQHVCIDFSNAAYSQNVLVKATDAVEEECPVSKQLGITESLLGEGLVWIPEDKGLAKDSGNWFKTKGEKHSVSKVKSVAAVCPEKLDSIKEFVEYACTTNRMQQGVDEVGLDQKSIGSFIGWVSKDINKEEGDVLEANNLTMKDVGKYIATESRKFYLQLLNMDV
tara:strand:- start:248 stop:1312 length:1065 start_codon:yes stop_codon:yes gene_type:complete